jgi:hypothetical protein
MEDVVKEALEGMGPLGGVGKVTQSKRLEQLLRGHIGNGVHGISWGHRRLRGMNPRPGDCGDRYAYKRMRTSPRP